MKTYAFHVSIPDSAQAWRKVELRGDQTLQDLHVAIQEALDWEPDDDIAFFLGDDPLGDEQQYVIFDGDDDEDDEDWEDDDLLEEDLEDELLDDEIEILVEGLPPIDIGDKPRHQSMQEMLDLLESDPEVRTQVAKMMTDQLGVPSFLVNMVLNNAKSLMSMMPQEMLSSMVGSVPEPLDAAEASLDSLGLAEGRSFVYMFGEDDWRFDVRVETIHVEADAETIYPRLLQAEGPAPEQYVDWDEADEEWLWDDEEDEDDFDEDS
jgi:hypothetical protein